VQCAPAAVVLLIVVERRTAAAAAAESTIFGVVVSIGEHEIFIQLVTARHDRLLENVVPALERCSRLRIFCCAAGRVPLSAGSRNVRRRRTEVRTSMSRATPNTTRYRARQA
jgi:predicted ABC-type ATPase